jgi:hypothetical protein
MMRATGAKLRMLASEAVALLTVVLGAVCGGEAEECGDEDDMALAAGRRAAQVRGGSEWLALGLDAAIGEDGGIQERCVDVQMGERAAQIKQQTRARECIRTIGDWQPSVLLFDFKLVPEALGLCVCAFSVHVCLVSVRRLDLHDHVVCLCIRLGLHGPLQLLGCGRHASGECLRRVRWRLAQ